MSRIVQEKFEVHAPQPPAPSHQWASDASVRDRHGLQTRNGAGRFEPYRGDLYQSLPPGTDMDDQEVYLNRSLPMAGCLGSGTQETEDVTKESLRAGFSKKRLRPTDDEFYREHNDVFYDDVGGFVERGNNLDRM